MRILCIGDSNTWGFDPNTGLRHENRWTRQLMALRPQDEIIEEGMNGRTFAFDDPFTPGRNGLRALDMLLMSHEPVDLVVVMLGTNDLKTFFNARAKAVARGARTFLRQIKNPFLYRYKEPDILMVAPILLGEAIAQTEGECGDFDEESLRQSKYLGREIQSVCEELGVAFLNAADFAHASPVDNVHMDETNHGRLARAIHQAIEERKKGEGQ